jgi:Flp pilus assembly protein TadB
VSRRLLFTFYLIGCVVGLVGGFLLIIYLHVWGALIAFVIGSLLTFRTFRLLRRSRRFANPS